jgi:ABC-2 type transport system ATP-binding protein
VGEAMVTGKAIVVDGITKSFGEVIAVNNLSFSVDHGSIYCLVGPNGAGKTTTLKIVVGLLKPDSGRVLIEGVDVYVNRVEALKRVGFVPDYPNLPAYLTPLEFFYYVASLRGFKRSDIEEDVRSYVKLFGLENEVNKPIIALSRGNLQKTAIIAALIVKPRVVVMDEPLTNIDIDSQIIFKKLVKKMAEEDKVAFLISSHMLPLIEGVCTHVGIIDRGRMIAEGDMDTILRIAGEKARFEDVYMKIMGKSI